MDLLLSWVIFGSAIGFSFHFLGISTKKNFLVAIILGIVGALTGGILGHYINLYVIDAYIAPSIIMSIGSVIAASISTKSKEGSNYAV